jgi:hypothetical protein
MRLPPALVLAGVARTLEEDVLPAVGDRAARGLVFTAIEVLANVQDLVEWRIDLRDEELTGAATALAEAAGRLEAIGLTAESARLRGVLAAAQAIPEREGRGRALDAALADALVAADGAHGRPGIADALGPVRAHLVNQTIRDLMRTQRPLLNRISQG